MNVIDLSHGVQSQNILQGAVLLADSYFYFPHGTVFVCVVDPGVGKIRSNYEEGHGRPLFLWNSASRLEIAWPRDSAQRRMNLKAGDSVVLKGNA